MSKKILRCSNLYKHFKQGSKTIEILNDINFELEESSAVAVVGPSGSGKTTLLNILSGLDSPTSGKVFFNEQDIAEISQDKKSLIRNKEIGFVYQFHHLLPELTASENVGLPALISGSNYIDTLKRSNDLLKKLNLDHRVNHKPSELSGGERQRVAVARALSNSPSCLIMDEPTGDLDTENAQQISDIILELRVEFCVSLLVATHDVLLSSRMDRVFKL